MIGISFVISLLVGCTKSPYQNCIDPEPVLSARVELQILSEDTETIRQTILGKPALAEYWQTQLTTFPPESDWRGWFSVFMIDPADDFNTEPLTVNPIRVLTSEDVHGYLMIESRFAKSHTIRVVFLFDFQPVPVTKEGESKFYQALLDVAPQEDHAFEFKFSNLPEGFHQFSILLIADPEDTRLDKDYRISQQGSFWEQRYDLWIDLDRIPDNVLTLPSKEEGIGAAGAFHHVEIITPLETQSNEPLEIIESSPGQTHCINLRVFNASPEELVPYSDLVPITIGIFWDDVLFQKVEYQLGDQSPTDIQINVQAPDEIGMHQLGIAVMPFAGYSQFDADLTRVVFPYSPFSRRVLVNVQP